MIAYLDHSRDTRLPLHGNVAYNDTGPGQAKAIYNGNDFRHIGIVPSLWVDFLWGFTPQVTVNITVLGFLIAAEGTDYDNIRGNRPEE